jgi:hypothetical protein
VSLRVRPTECLKYSELHNRSEHANRLIRSVWRVTQDLDLWRVSCACAYLRLGGTGKSPWQLLGHCVSMRSASRFGNNSAESVTSAETDDPTVTQSTDAMKMSTMTSFARQLQGNRRGSESGRFCLPAPNAMHSQTTATRACGRVRIANRTGKQFTRADPDKRFREPTLMGTRIRLFDDSEHKKTPGAGAPGVFPDSGPSRIQVLPGVSVEAASLTLIPIFSATAMSAWLLARP